MAEKCNLPIRDRSPEYVITSDVLGIISGIFVIQRFVFKICTKRDIGWDDWFVLATAVSGVPSTVIITYGVAANGIGRDIWTLDFAQISKFGMYFFITENLYFLYMSLVKLSLLCFFLRIFPDEIARRLLRGTVVFVFIYGLVFVFVGTFACSPVNFFWTRWDREHTGRCLDVDSIILAHAGIGIFLDLWMLAIPLWQIKGLNLHWKKKLGVIAMFCLGTL